MILTPVSPHERDRLLWREEQPPDREGWYRRDDNGVPPEYCLLPREGCFRDSEVWAAEEQALREMLVGAIDRLGWAPDDPRRVKYDASATHREILHGILRKKFEVQEPWRSRFEALGREPQFQDVQVRTLEPFFRRAVALADEYGLRSERGLALCFNIIFVQGGIRGTAKDDINAALVAFERERQRQPSEVERMHIIADAVTKSSPLQGYIGARYLLIANGGGSTPGGAVDLNERGIRLIDFRTGQPISEATTG